MNRRPSTRQKHTPFYVELSSRPFRSQKAADEWLKSSLDEQRRLWGKTNRCEGTLSRKLRTCLARVAPHIPAHLRDEVVYNLGEIWGAGERYRAALGILSRMRSPEDLTRAEEILDFALYQFVPHLEYHFRRLKRSVPKMCEAIEQKPRNGRRSPLRPE